MLSILENSSNDDAYSSVSYSRNWPSIYRSNRSSSPKLYTLVRNIKTANLEKRLSLKQQNSNEDENGSEIHSATDCDHPQVFNDIIFIKIVIQTAIFVLSINRYLSHHRLILEHLK
jgi:hypothetical protein